MSATRTKGSVGYFSPPSTHELTDSENIALVIANKYRRALRIKQTLPALRDTMALLGIETRSVFETWLEKEKEYLQSLSKEPVHETLEMEYYQQLVNLHDHE